MSRSESRAETSRVNGARSRGPVTPEGKTKSSQNATTHGLFSEAILLQSESREEWMRLAEDLIARFKPADNVERNLINEMAIASWRARRAVAMETALIEADFEMALEVERRPETPEQELRLYAIAYANAVGRMKATLELGRQSERLNRLWMRLHAKLVELQKQRKADEAEAAEAAKAKWKNEPGVVEVNLNQRDVDREPARPAAAAPPALRSENQQVCFGSDRVLLRARLAG